MSGFHFYGCGCRLRSCCVVLCCAVLCGNCLSELSGFESVYSCKVCDGIMVYLCSGTAYPMSDKCKICNVCVKRAE